MSCLMNFLCFLAAVLLTGFAGTLFEAAVRCQRWRDYRACLVVALIGLVCTGLAGFLIVFPFLR